VPNPQKPGLSDNTIGAIAYLSPLPAFFFLTIRRYNKRPYVRFHAWQSIVFNAFVFLFGLGLKMLLPYVKFVGAKAELVVLCLISLTIFLTWMWCVVGALNGRNCKLPVIGAWADEQAYR